MMKDCSLCSGTGEHEVRVCGHGLCDCSGEFIKCPECDGSGRVNDNHVPIWDTLQEYLDAI